MIGRKLTLGLVALGLSVGLASSPVYAKPCPKKCKTEIMACKTACADQTGKAKKRCRNACKKAIIMLCHERANPTACSPSGAFLDQ